jgi:hypothetical protein
MLGYRSLFTADRAVVGRDLQDEARAQIHSWLRKAPRNFDTDAMGDGITVFPDGSRGMYVRRQAKDGSDTLRFRLSEEKTDGIWSTRLTVRTAPNERSWGLLEVEDPTSRDAGFGKRQRVEPPGLARNLLDSVDAEDGPLLLRTKPSRYLDGSLSALLDLVESSDRRGLLVLGAQSDRGAEPQWERTLEEVARRTAGQASVLTLPPELVAEWNDVVIEQRLPWGGVRIFYPGTVMYEPAHAQRNLYFTRDRIDEKSPQGVGKRIGWLAREHAVRSPLPASVRRVERVMDDFESEQVISVWTARSREVRQEAASKAESVIDQLLEAATQETAPQEAIPESVAPSTPWMAEDLAAAQSLLSTTVGEGWTLTQSIEYLLLFSEDNESQIEQSRAYTNDILNQVANLKEDLALAEMEREAAQEEASQAEARLLAAEDRVRYLQQALVSKADYETAYGLVPVQHKTVVPDDFDDLLQAMEDLEYVRFIGNPERTRELNELDGRMNAVQKAYTALLALSDYAKAKAAGDFEGNVETYLRNTPQGYRSWSANRHADSESEDVGKQPRFRKPRTFWVDDLERDVYMESHFKITQENMRSPRLHYFDATAQKGLIYVGYLGPHLPTKQTN